MLRRLAHRAYSLASSSSSISSEGLPLLLRSFATNSHDHFNVHKESKDNNWETPFEFSAATMKKVNELLSHYPTNYKQSAMLPLLDIAQQENNGWLSLSAMNKVAQVLEVPEIRVATFYTMYNRSKMGKYHIMVCGTTPCRLQGAEKIEHAIKAHLGLSEYGETTQDGMFTLSEMECMGACVNAPMIAVADYSSGIEGFSYNFYEDLTTTDVVNVLETLKRGEKPKMGSQHRDKAEPAGAVVGAEKWVPAEGVKTLQGTPPGPYCRDLGEIPPPKTAAAAAK